MRQVLLALALTTNAPAAKMDADSGGGSVRYYSDTLLAGTLGPGDAPHLFYAELYAAAATDDERARVFDEAKKTLEAILRSRGDPTKVETREQLHARIVEHGEGWPKLEVARWARTSEYVVARARRDAGRDEEFGRPAVDFSELKPEDRRSQVRTRAARGMNAKEIARSMNLPYITVRRDLGRSA